MSDFQQGKGGKNGRERKKEKKGKCEHYGSRRHIDATVNRVTSSVQKNNEKTSKKRINS